MRFESIVIESALKNATKWFLNRQNPINIDNFPTFSIFSIMSFDSIPILFIWVWSIQIELWYDELLANFQFEMNILHKYRKLELFHIQTRQCM